MGAGLVRAACLAAGRTGDGIFKVTRGGSHGTYAYYLRSANRAAALPETQAFTIGFRVACAEPLERRSSIAVPGSTTESPAQQTTSRQPAHAPDPQVPYVFSPVPFVHIPANPQGPLYSWHNHDTTLTECPNGDLLAAWYTCAREQGRELSVACSRLLPGEHTWTEAESFYDTPDRDDHGPALWCDGEGTVYHLNGTALSHYWEPLQIVLRESKDNGVTWSRPRYIAPDFGLRSMVCQPIFVLRNGWLMALGRGANVNNHLPMSFSSDFGATWKAQAMELPPITLPNATPST